MSGPPDAVGAHPGATASLTSGGEAVDASGTVRALRRRAGDLAVLVPAAALELYVWHGGRGLRGGGQVPVWLIPALVLAAFAVLPWRGRYPVAVWVVQFAVAAVAIPVPGYQPFAGLLIALHAVARRCSARVATVVLAGCAVPFGVDSYDVAAGGTSPPLPVFAVSVVLWSAVCAGVWGLGRRGHNVHRHALAEQRRREAETAAAIRAERLRLARELHDIVANAVSAMLLQAAGARGLVGVRDDQVRQALRVIEDSGVLAIEELHRLLDLLRTDDDGRAGRGATDPHHTTDPHRATDWHAAGGRDTTSGGYPAEDRPGLDDLPALIERSRAAGLDVAAGADGERTGSPDPSVALAAYRVVQEALANAAKHAGPGARVHVHQSWHRDRLTLTVRDRAGADRSAATVPSSGHGLRGLTERVTLVGGTLTAGPVEGGFLVRAELPLRPPPAVTG